VSDFRFDNFKKVVKSEFNFRFDNSIQTYELGSHRLTVNTQPFELTWVPDHGGAALSLTGTEFTQILTEVTWGVRITSHRH